LLFPVRQTNEHDGESERRMGRAIEDRRDAVFLMTKACTHGRDARVAMRQLDESLRRLRTDYLDLWQIHECVYDNDPDRHFAKGGVVEALERAKAQGKVGYVGFTGHKHPDIHLRMLSFDFPFDACQLPLNGFDALFRSFQKRVLPELARRRIAAIGMKSLGGDGRVITKKAARVEDAMRYAMSLPVPLRAESWGSRGRRTIRAVQDERGTRRRGRPQAARFSLAGRSRVVFSRNFFRSHLSDKAERGR
jgi:aryl-alcohol dehydrogenase-like predicted oxidoreductase